MKSIITQISQIADKLYDDQIDSSTKKKLLVRLEKLSFDYFQKKNLENRNFK